jgi:Domain of unknown function (DUF4169)
MGDLINLRQARKAKKRAAHQAKSAQNRVTFGTPRALSAINEIRQKLVDRGLDGARLEQAKTHEPD